MSTTIADLDKRLVELGWTSDRAEFGRQSWTIPITNGRADIFVRVEGNGIVGRFTLVGFHPDEDEVWESEDVVLDVGALEGSSVGLRVHRSEGELANILARYATVLAATIEREE